MTLRTPGQQWLMRFTSLLIVCATFLTACSKPTETIEAPGAAPTENERLTSGAEDTVAAANVAQLTQTVRKYAAEKQRAPKNLQELVAAGYLDNIPAAPPGKTFAIDKNLQVYLADR